MRALVALGLAGALVEVGCGWVWWWSPGLTALYNPDYTREVLARLPPALRVATQDFADVHSMVVCIETGLLLMTLGYLAALGSLRTVTRPATKLVVGFAVLHRLTLASLPGLFSTDIFSYVMYGRIAGVYGQNPYLHTPSEFPNDPFLAWVFPFWRDQPTVYGPVWTALSGRLSTLTGNLSNFDQVSVYRLVLLAAELASLGVLWWLLGRLQPHQRTFAFALFAWNPLVLFDLVGSTHNDGLMLALMLLGLVPFVRGSARPLGIVVVWLSALVKYTTVLLAPILTLMWAAQGASTRVKAHRLIGGAGLGAMVAGVLWWPWLQSTDVLHALGAASSVRLVLNSTPDLLALTVADRVLAPAGTDLAMAQDISRLWMRAFTRLTFGVYFVWELWRVWRRPTLRTSLEAATRALLILPLLVLTWVWSWYFTWSLALAVLLGWSSRLAQVVVACTLVWLPVVVAHQYLNDDLPGVFVMLATLVPMLMLLRRAPAIMALPSPISK